jgi:hypothetical protein
MSAIIPTSRAPLRRSSRISGTRPSALSAAMGLGQAISWWISAPTTGHG